MGFDYRPLLTHVALAVSLMVLMANGQCDQILAVYDSANPGAPWNQNFQTLLANSISGNVTVQVLSQQGMPDGTQVQFNWMTTLGFDPLITHLNEFRLFDNETCAPLSEIFAVSETDTQKTKTFTANVSAAYDCQTIYALHIYGQFTSGALDGSLSLEGPGSTISFAFPCSPLLTCCPPSPSVTPSPVPSPSVAPSPVPSPSVAPSPTVNPSPAPSPTTTPSPAPSTAPSPSPMVPPPSPSPMVVPSPMPPTNATPSPTSSPCDPPTSVGPGTPATGSGELLIYFLIFLGIIGLSLAIVVLMRFFRRGQRRSIY